ncbi:39S ribosomal protein L36, mitochondrial [Protopterus annectens]|uniref:39S ribosomal protein L36, mitochondrial n=1 Tax=Protopterus annectens TaxID=7888 RepID=UPI001CFA6E53|nr:39S ribosomal protein L36, mitochondrial [Protopterus annectens]XP_043921022.1 39S ribosomal protein L36, mitochondrial [Protopterus annectens]
MRSSGDNMASMFLKSIIPAVTRPLFYLSRCHAGRFSFIAAAYRHFNSAVPVKMGFLQVVPNEQRQGAVNFLGMSRLPYLQHLAGMKTKSAIRKRCKDCFIVRRRGRLFVFCKTHPRHKQRQG